MLKIIACLGISLFVAMFFARSMAGHYRFRTKEPFGEFLYIIYIYIYRTVRNNNKFFVVVSYFKIAKFDIGPWP